MSGFVTDFPLQWAARRAAERRVVVGLLGIRALRYVGQSVPPIPPAIEGLQVVAVGAAEVPTFHAETGLYGFVRLPPGPSRIELSDATGRFQPYAVTAVVPDRGPIGRALETGGAPPLLPGPLLVDVALRLMPAAATSPGMTTVWGVVREASSGTPVPLARIACTTVGGGSVVAYAGRDGGYLLAFPAERPASLATPPQFVFPRTLALHSPSAAIAAALATTGFVGGMPADLDSINPDAAGSPFTPRSFQLRATGGSVTPGPNPALPVLAAQRSRWDIELLP
jgi:hypothetical protein